MGMITDRTRTRYGKFRPFIFVSSFLMPLFTIMLFFTPDVGPITKIIYIYVSYIGWDMAYTISDIPKWSMTSVMTSDKQEQVGLISWAKIFGMVGNIGVNIIVIPLVLYFGKTQTAGVTDYVAGYRWMAIVLSLIVMAGSLLMFFGTKERIEHHQPAPSAKESLRSVFGNKPLMQLLLSLLLMTSVNNIVAGLNVHYVKYCLGAEKLMPIISMLTIVPMLLGAGMTGVLTKRFSRKKLFMITLSAFVLFGGLRFLAGYGNLAVVVTLMCLSNFFMGLMNVVMVAILNASIDYGERTTGQRNEGIVFSSQTFVTKFSAAIGGSVSVLLLPVIGYVQNAAQSTATMNKLHAMMTLVPVCGAILALLPMLLNKTDYEKAEPTAKAE